MPEAFLSHLPIAFMFAIGYLVLIGTAALTALVSKGKRAERALEVLRILAWRRSP